MVLSKTILILEDNLKVLSEILDKLYKLEQDQPFDLLVIALTTYLQVEEYINSNPRAKFDVILLDRDCKLGGSFHVLNLAQFNPNIVIAISSIPEFNEELKQKGVTRVILKDYANLEKFAENLAEEVGKMIRKPVKVLFK